MYPNKIRNNQRGFLLPLALFIVVVMGLFALVLSRNTIQTGLSGLQEVSSVQAFYAAESGAQKAMQTLFFPSSSVRQQVDTRCINLASSPLSISYNVTGLKNCTATVTCTCQFQDGSSCAPITAANYSTSAAPVKLMSFYKISSAATCGLGNQKATRTIEAGSFLKQE